MSFLQRFLGGAFESARMLGPVRWDIALTTFRALSWVMPNTAWVQRDLGRAYTGKQQWSEAEAACQRAVELSPQDAWGFYALAECQIAQKNWEAAEKSCQQSLKLDSESGWFHHQYSKVLQEQERLDECLAACEKALAAEANVSWFYHSLGMVQLKLGQCGAAIASLQKSLELNGGFPWAKYHLGQALVAENRLEEAIALYETAQASHPEMADTFSSSLCYPRHLQKQQECIRAYITTWEDHHRARENQIQANQAQANQAQPNQAQPNPPTRPLDILLVTPYPTYPPKLGAITRMYEEARGLGKHHRLVVASFAFSPEDCEPLAEEMAQYCALPVVVQLGDAPMPDGAELPQLIRKYGSQRMEQLLKQLSVIQFDIVCFDFIYMAQYRHLFHNAYTVLGEHNIESSLLQRFADLKPQTSDVNRLMKEAAAVEAFANADLEKERLATYEDQQWPKFSLRTVVSELDRAELDRRCPNLKTWVINNGIDTEEKSLLDNTGARKLFFFGTLTYFPNIDGAQYFVREVLPLIWKEAPELELCIAGSNPPPTVLELAEDPRIEVIANPETMTELAMNCSISVVPLRVGGGTRIKILHAMAMGLPVVSTSLGCEGLEGVDGAHLLIRDQPEAFAQAVLSLDRDEQLCQKLRQQGRSLVENRYDWQSIYRDYEARLFDDYQQWQLQMTRPMTR